MRHLATTLTTVVVISIQLLAQTQKPLTPTAPGTAGDPMWQGILRLSDGRTFVTDGGLAMDAALAKPAKLPDRVLSSKVLEEQYFKATHKNEYALSDLSAAATGKTYTTPGGIGLNATYVNYLRRTLPRSARLRVAAPGQPIVIVANDTVVGVLMPVAQ